MKPSALTIAPGILLWRQWLDRGAQESLLAGVRAGLEQAPLYRPVMPGTGKAFTALESNFGPLGWVADKSGYRYQPLHPVTQKPWPAMPDGLTALWRQLAGAFCPDPPPLSCCLVNFYRDGARMGAHQDRDENDILAPVIGISLGDSALFRIGGPSRKGPSRTLPLESGDVIGFGGPARLAFHGIDRVRAGTSTLIAGGGRISLTLRHVRT